MKIQTLIFLGLSLLSAINTGWSSGKITWQCVAKDDDSKQWMITSSYQRNATNHAIELCKKESIHPLTCKVDGDDCDSLVNGLSTKPLWRCVALDQSAKPWTGNLSQNRDSAAISAQSICKEQSQMPGTCYINILTCTNLTSRE